MRDVELDALLGDGPAPEGWSDVAALLRRAADIAPNGAPAPELLDALVAAATAPDAPAADEAPARRVVARRTIGITVAAAAVVLGAGSAAAANGSLPGPVQSVVHDVASVVGLEVPDGPPSSGGSQDGPGHGRSDEAPGRPEEPGRPDEPGRADEAPGRPEEPGRPDEPGRADEAPGRLDPAPSSTDAPGRSEDAPGQDPAHEPGPPADVPADLPAEAEDTGPPASTPSTVPSPPTSATPPSTGGAGASGGDRGSHAAEAHRQDD